MTDRGVAARSLFGLLLGASLLSGCVKQEVKVLPTTPPTAGPRATADAKGQEEEQFLSALENTPPGQRQAYASKHPEMGQRISVSSDPHRMERMIKLLTQK